MHKLSKHLAFLVYRNCKWTTGLRDIPCLPNNFSQQAWLSDRLPNTPLVCSYREALHYVRCHNSARAWVPQSQEVLGYQSLWQLSRDSLPGQLLDLRAGDGLKAPCRLVSVYNGYWWSLSTFSKTSTDTYLLVSIKQHLPLDHGCEAKHQLGVQDRLLVTRGNLFRTTRRKKSELQWKLQAWITRKCKHLWRQTSNVHVFG